MMSVNQEVRCQARTFVFSLRSAFKCGPEVDSDVWLPVLQIMVPLRNHIEGALEEIIND